MPGWVVMWLWILAYDVGRIITGKPTMTAWYQEAIRKSSTGWKWSLFARAAAVDLTTLYVVCHLQGQPKALLRYDPLLLLSAIVRQKILFKNHDSTEICGIIPS